MTAWKPKREAAYTGFLRATDRYPRRGKKLHAIEHQFEDGIHWYRLRCQRVWRTKDAIEEYDYRYREYGTQCRHQACSWAFNWELVG